MSTNCADSKLAGFFKVPENQAGLVVSRHIQNHLGGKCARIDFFQFVHLSTIHWF